MIMWIKGYVKLTGISGRFRFYRLGFCTSQIIHFSQADLYRLIEEGVSHQDCISVVQWFQSRFCSSFNDTFGVRDNDTFSIYEQIFRVSRQETNDILKLYKTYITSRASLNNMLEEMRQKSYQFFFVSYQCT